MNADKNRLKCPIHISNGNVGLTVWEPISRTWANFLPKIDTYYIHYTVWDEITGTLPKSTAVEVYQRICNLIPISQSTDHVIIYSCLV